MSDLSKVLGDLYGADDQPSAAPPRNFRAEAPEWADEQRLDDAFADWTPGPDAHAHALEHEVVLDAPAVPAARLDDDMAAAMSAALVAGNGEPEVPVAEAPAYSFPMDTAEPVFEPVEPVEPAAPQAPLAVEDWLEPTPSRPWSRLDDDILPTAGKTVRLPKVKAPKAPKAPKAKVPKAKAPQAPKAESEKKAVKLPKLQLKKGSKAEKAAKAEKPAKNSDAQPKKFFGLQLRRG